MAELLLNYKADVDSTNNWGGTPLLWAAGDGHLDIVELLVAHKANINVKDWLGQTPLHRAAFMHHKEVVEFLRQQGGHE